MRKLKKFKKFSQGGLGSSEGYGDPFANKTEFEPGRGEKNLEGIKDFFGFGKKPSAAEDRKETKAEERKDAPAKAEPVNPAETKPVETGRGKIQQASTMTGEESRADYDKGAKPDSFTTTASKPPASTTRPAASSAPKPARITQDSEAGKSRGMRGSGPPVTTVSTKSKPPGPEDIPSTEASKGPRGEEIDNSSQFAQSAMAAFPALRGASAGVRGAISGATSLGRMFESAAKPTPKSEPTLAPSTPASSTTPRGGDPRAAANRRAAEEKETPTRVDPRAAANRRAAESEAKESPTRVDPRAAANRRSAESEGKEAPKEVPKAKSTADDEVAQEAAKRAATSRRKVTPKRQEDSSKFGGGKGTPSKSKTKAEVKPTANKFDRPVGEKEGPSVDKVLESKGLAAKKGGKIPAFKKGGFVSRGDGCAQRGKTKGRMV